MAFFRSIGVTLEMIKWEHSIFALPFALTGAMLAAGGLPRPVQIFWIIVCMVTARSAAMAFNRWADASLDAANPRTRSRAIPAGQLARGFVAGFTCVMAALFVLAAGQLKRFTRWSHLALGVALGIAPTAAWIAVRGSLDLRILILTLAVMFWVAGFDLLYACQDAGHDRDAGLFSVPSTYGVKAAFWIARVMHLTMMVLLVWLVRVFALGPAALIGVGVVGSLLLYEHLIVSPRDLRRLNAAFFTMNGVISAVFFLFVAADLLLRR